VDLFFEIKLNQLNWTQSKFNLD